MSRRRMMYGGYDKNTVLMLHFDDSLTKDSSGKNQTVTVVGSPSLVAGKFGTAMKTTTSSSHVYTNRNLFADLVSTGNYTVECFVSMPSGAGDVVVFGLDNGGTSAVYMIISAVLVRFGSASGASGASITANINIQDGVFRHVAISSEGGLVRMFIDGVLAGNKKISLNLPYGVNFTIGGRAANAFSTNVIIDDFRISNIARYTADFTPPTKPLK